MRVMVLRTPRPAIQSPLELEHREIPRPGPGQLRLRVLACGVCHTDLHECEGDIALPRRPIVPGHQIVGVVDALGVEVVEPAIGTRVGVAWVHGTCGVCRECEEGRENLCDSARFTGLHVDGGYAEFALARADFVHALPSGVADHQAAPLLCAGIIGLRALRLSGARPRQRLGLWGFGASAHIAIQIARHWDCEVFVFTRGEAHREHARALGAAWCGGPNDAPPGLLDAAVNFTPAGETVPAGLRALRRGGTLSLAGIHMSALPSLDYDLICGERTLRSVANATRQDARDLLALAAQIPIRTDVELYPLADANRALVALSQSRIRGAAVLSVP